MPVQTAWYLSDTRTETRRTTGNAVTEFDVYGKSRTVTSVDVAWNLGDTRTDDFDIQVSSDGVAWTTVLSHQISSGTTLDRQFFDFSDAVARYVKYVGHQLGQTWRSTPGWTR